MSDPVARLNAAPEGRYAIERELGEGGMAQRVRAIYDQSLNRLGFPVPQTPRLSRLLHESRVFGVSTSIPTRRVPRRRPVGRSPFGWSHVAVSHQDHPAIAPPGHHP